MSVIRIQNEKKVSMKIISNFVKKIKKKKYEVINYED